MILMIFIQRYEGWGKYLFISALPLQFAGFKNIHLQADKIFMTWSHSIEDTNSYILRDMKIISSILQKKDDWDSFTSSSAFTYFYIILNWRNLIHSWVKLKRLLQNQHYFCQSFSNSNFLSILWFKSDILLIGCHIQ